METFGILKDKNLMEVVAGVWRCGESTLKARFYDLLRRENSNVSILAIKVDMREFRLLAEKNWKEIYDYITKHFKRNAANYVFIHEVQNVAEFEKLFGGFYIHPDKDF